MVVRILLLVLGLKAAAHGDIRARDPGEEEEEPQWLPVRSGHDGGGAGGSWGPVLPRVLGTYRHSSPRAAAHHPLAHGYPSEGQGHSTHDGPEDTAPPSGEAGAQNIPARTGNWCAFVHPRMATTAVVCGTEKYTIRSQSPCPNATPDCQLVMYKLSTRPVYREMQKIVTALLWRCCPGHGGHNCEDTAEGPNSDLNNRTAEIAQLGAAESHNHTGDKRSTHLEGHRNREQNDVQVPGGPLYDTPHSEEENRSSESKSAHHHDHHHDHSHDHIHGRDLESYTTEAEGLQTFPDITKMLMAQLQPLLDGFNQTLQHLSEEVAGLSSDMAELKHHLKFPGGPVGGPVEGPVGVFEAKLEEGARQLNQMRALLSQQSSAVEERIHSQQVMLHYNLTNFKMETDSKIKRHQKTIQASLHSLNTSLAELRLNQEPPEEMAIGSGRPSQSQPEAGPAVWEAIDRLDNKVMNNTKQIGSMLSNMESVEILQQDFDNMKISFKDAVSKGTIQYMETVLEVDMYRNQILERVNELASNLSTIFGDQLKEIDSDVDYLYQQFYKNISFQDCNCKALAVAMSTLEQRLANVTELANENRLAREDNMEGQNRWEVDDLRTGLVQVQEAMAFEQDQTRSLHQTMSQLQSLQQSSQQEIEILQKKDEQKVKVTQRLSSYFDSLLKDAIRHSEVLETLLGEEVLEFTERKPSEKEQYSIPMLQEKIQHMQEQIRSQNLSVHLLRKAAWPHDHVTEHEHSVSTERTSRELARRSEDHRREDPPDSLMGDRPDHSTSDPRGLEKDMEELGAELSRLKVQRCLSCCNCTENTTPGGQKLEPQSEMSLLRKGLEDHLQLFKNVFSNTERLAGSENTVDLDQLWAMIKKKEGKRQRRRNQGKRHLPGEGKVHPHSRRDVSLDTSVASWLSDAPPIFLAGTHNGANQTGAIIFEVASLNHGQAYSPVTGVFRAPTAGVYLLVLTLEFGSGPSLASLKRGDQTVATLRWNQRRSGGSLTRVLLLELKQGERIHVELSLGTVEHGTRADNTFAGLQLFVTA